MLPSRSGVPLKCRESRKPSAPSQADRSLAAPSHRPPDAPGAFGYWNPEGPRSSIDAFRPRAPRPDHPGEPRRRCRAIPRSARSARSRRRRSRRRWLSRCDCRRRSAAASASGECSPRHRRGSKPVAVVFAGGNPRARVAVVSIQCSLPSMVASRMACVPHGEGTVFETWPSSPSAQRGQLDREARLAQHHGQQLAGVLAVAEAIGRAQSRAGAACSRASRRPKHSGRCGAASRSGPGLLSVGSVRPLVDVLAGLRTSSVHFQHSAREPLFPPAATSCPARRRSSSRRLAAVPRARAGCRPAAAGAFRWSPARDGGRAAVLGDGRLDLAGGGCILEGPDPWAAARATRRAATG